MRLAVLWSLVVSLLIGGIAAAVTMPDGDGAAYDALPSRPLTDRVEWSMAYINDGEGEGEIDEVLSSSFLAAVPADRFKAITETQVRPSGPFTVVRVVDAEATGAVLLLRGEGGAEFFCSSRSKRRHLTESPACSSNRRPRRDPRDRGRRSKTGSGALRRRSPFWLLTSPVEGASRCTRWTRSSRCRSRPHSSCTCSGQWVAP